ncbi:MAG: hypothetical protein K2X66_16640 [Cyanobacteria bacterium]|nr:hypothetical protein [Cyanobacteriota bacterium]
MLNPANRPVFLDDPSGARYYSDLKAAKEKAKKDILKGPKPQSPASIASQTNGLLLTYFMDKLLDFVNFKSPSE